MAKYASFKYGDGTHYGYTADPALADRDFVWSVLVDWDNDGVFAGSGEQDYLKSFSSKRGRENYLTPGGSGFEHMPGGGATLTMNNTSRRYDPRYAAGPLYGSLIPGRKIQVKIITVANPPVSKVIFTGLIDDIAPVTTNCLGETRLECIDLQQFINDQVVKDTAYEQPLLKTNIRDAAISVLDSIEYPLTHTLDAEAQPVIMFSANDQNAGECLSQLADACMGVFFVDVNGRAKLYTRSHSYSITATINDTDCTDAGIVVAQPWNEVYTKVNLTCHRWTRELNCIVWFLPAPVGLTANVPVTVYPEYDPAVDLAVNLDTFAANSNQDGSGTDISSSMSLVSETYGLTRGQVTGVNTQNGFITRLEVRGKRWTEVAENLSNLGSTATYGLRVLNIDSPWMQDVNYATSFAASLRDFTDNDREGLVIQIRDNPTLQFGLDLMDKVTFVSTALTINANYWVQGIAHEATEQESGVLVTTTLWLRKIYTNSTSITAAPIIDMEAPPGYNDPGTDPNTRDDLNNSDDPPISSVEAYEEGTLVQAASELNFIGTSVTVTQGAVNPDTRVDITITSGAAPSPIYCQLSAVDPATVSGPGGVGAIIRWGVGGPADISRWYTVDTAKYVVGCTLLGTPNDYKIQIDTNGLYYVTLTGRSEHLGGDDVTDTCEIIVLRGINLINSSGTSWTDIASTTVGELVINRITVHSDGLFLLEAGDIVECMYYTENYQDFYVAFRMFCIART